MIRKLTFDLEIAQMRNFFFFLVYNVVFSLFYQVKYFYFTWLYFITFLYTVKPALMNKSRLQIWKYFPQRCKAKTKAKEILAPGLVLKY